MLVGQDMASIVQDDSGSQTLRLGRDIAIEAVHILDAAGVDIDDTPVDGVVDGDIDTLFRGEFLTGQPDIRLDICNNGEPIPTEIREQIFIPFFTTRESGSGIGLSLSRQIMLKLGGDITLDPADSVYTCFKLSLPV